MKLPQPRNNNNKNGNCGIYFSKVRHIFDCSCDSKYIGKLVICRKRKDLIFKWIAQISHFSVVIFTYMISMCYHSEYRRICICVWKCWINWFSKLVFKLPNIKLSFSTTFFLHILSKITDEREGNFFIII